MIFQFSLELAESGWQLHIVWNFMNALALFIVFSSLHNACEMKRLLNMKLRSGQNCAACVPINDKGVYAWFLTKVDKRHGSKYIVRDEYSDINISPDRYTIDMSHVSPFPLKDETYIVGDNVLALWRDKVSNEWSTMFFESQIVNISEDRQQIEVVYKGTDYHATLDDSKITRVPPDFNLSGTATPASCGLVGEAPPPPELPIGTSLEEIIPQERRRYKALFLNEEQPETECDPDGFIESFMNPVAPFQRNKIDFSTELLNEIDEDPFFDEGPTHITGSGSIVLQGIELPTVPSSILSGAKCGRLGHIFNRWKFNQ